MGALEASSYIKDTVFILQHLLQLNLLSGYRSF